MIKKVRVPKIKNNNLPKSELYLCVFLRMLIQSVLSINDASDMRIIFFNKFNLGKLISSFCKLKESKIQTIKLTITEDKIIPTTPKLKGERLPKFLIGAPIKTQSKKILNIIPTNEDLKGKFVFSIE